MPTSTTRNAPRAVTYLLIVVGVVLAVVSVVYMTRTAGHLPSFFLGHQAGSVHKHVKHGVAALALAIACWVGAWLASGQRRTRA